MEVKCVSILGKGLKEKFMKCFWWLIFIYHPKEKLTPWQVIAEWAIAEQRYVSCAGLFLWASLPSTLQLQEALGSCRCHLTFLPTNQGCQVSTSLLSLIPLTGGAAMDLLVSPLLLLGLLTFSALNMVNLNCKPLLLWQGKCFWGYLCLVSC